MQIFVSSFQRLNSAEERSRRNIAEAVPKGPTAGVGTEADGVAAANGSAIAAVAAGVATGGVSEVAEVAIAIATVAADEKIPDRCVPRISIKNRRQKDMNLPRDSSPKKLPMSPSNEELMRELSRLRSEIQQLREVVSALFNAVFEEGEEDWDTVPEKDEFNLYN